ESEPTVCGNSPKCWGSDCRNAVVSEALLLAGRAFSFHDPGLFVSVPPSSGHALDLLQTAADLTTLGRSRRVAFESVCGFVGFSPGLPPFPSLTVFHYPQARIGSTDGLVCCLIACLVRPLSPPLWPVGRPPRHASEPPFPPPWPAPPAPGLPAPPPWPA